MSGAAGASPDQEDDTMRYMLLMNYGTSAAPGPDGMPIRQRIEVREVMGAPDPEL